MGKFKLVSVICLLMIVLAFVSCSGGKNPIIPESSTPSSGTNLPDKELLDGTNNRTPLAIYDAAIDSKTGTFTFTPNQRNADYHYPLSRLYPDVLTVTRYGFTPNFWADIKISHPLPNSGIDAFDPRVIAILPANPGVSMSYPTLDVLANNSVVLNPDGYTKLYDNLGGSIPGNTNPFLAYFKQVEYRRWFSSGTGFTSDTRRWEMNIDGFGGPMTFKLVVDVSLNYPDPPQQVIDNATEPVQIEAVIGTGLLSTGGSAAVNVTLLDWQGQTGIGGVLVEAPDLFNSTVALDFSQPGPDPNEYIFSGTITNQYLAPYGSYDILIAAWDAGTNIYIYSEFTALVRNDINFNPINITPPWINFNPRGIAADDNYLYTVGGIQGLHIFDISDPYNPDWLIKADTFAGYSNLEISSGYAYLSGGYSDSLRIFDIEPPQAAHPVGVFLTSIINDMAYDNGYAFLLTNDLGLQIVDVDPPETPQLINQLFTGEYLYDIKAVDGYAYVRSNSDIRIIDVDPPESAYVVKTIDIIGISIGEISNGYAYLISGSGFYIYDVDPPESAHEVNFISQVPYPYSLTVKNGYAFTTLLNKMIVYDIDPPESAYQIASLDMAHSPDGIFVNGNYAYIISNRNLSTPPYGVEIIDISDPFSPNEISRIDTTCGVTEIDTENGYTYATSNLNFYIVDAVTPGQEKIENLVSIDHNNNIFTVSEGYAYVSGLDTPNLLNIIDIDPPNQAGIIKSIELPAGVLDIQIADGYAYLLALNTLIIVDIEPIDSTHIVKTVTTSTGLSIGTGLAVSGGYAYCSIGYLSFQSNMPIQMIIVDVNPPDEAAIIKSLDVDNPSDDHSGAGDICVDGGEAYVIADFLFSNHTEERWCELYKIDIDQPELAHTIGNGIRCGLEHSNSLSAYDGYLYIAGDKLSIFDPFNWENAAMIDINCNGVDVEGNKAFTAGAYGLQIIQLW